MSVRSRSAAVAASRSRSIERGSRDGGGRRLPPDDVARARAVCIVQPVVSACSPGTFVRRCRQSVRKSAASRRRVDYKNIK